MAIAQHAQPGTTPLYAPRAAKIVLNQPPHEYITMADEPQRQDSPERGGRNSFSSIREDDRDLAQTFTTTKISSFSTPPASPVDEAVVDDDGDNSAAPGTMVEAHFCPPVTQPSSRLHGNWFPATSFKGWKQISVGGKLASKSFSDLQGLNLAWKPSFIPTSETEKDRAGESPFEKLPIELLTAIIKLLVIDVPPNGVEKRNVDLIALLLTSKTIHAVTLDCLYQRVTIPHSRIFHKFLTHVSGHNSLGTMVRRLDFSHFNPSTLFSTASERSQARNLTSETLLKCLELTPHLQEFLAQEYVDEDLDEHVLRKLLMDLPRMEAVDFCGCFSAKFLAAVNAIVKSDWPATLTIKRLSLHRCMTLPSTIFDLLLPRMRGVTHLDVAHTKITDAALWSIPPTARITHLNLAKCKWLTAAGVTKFLSEHPAVVDSLEFLSLGTDARSHELLDEDDLTKLIPILPKTLKSLSLKGSNMTSSHIPLLLQLTKHLEELAVGRALKLSDIQRLFFPDPRADVKEQMEWVPHTIRYLDLSDIWGENRVSNSELFNDSGLLRPYSQPLQVIEFSDEVIKRVRKSAGALNHHKWRASETSSRSWLVRMDNDGDDGSRSWKMGAKFWGMRKVPVAKAEVGGMYGNFMFGRKL